MVLSTCSTGAGVSYRDFDPMEDTERSPHHKALGPLPLVTGTSIRWRILKEPRGAARNADGQVSYRDFDPMEDTESSHFTSDKSATQRLQGLRSDGGY